MALDERIREWFRRERESLLRRFQMLQAGTLATGEKKVPDTAWVDTTSRDIERIRRQLGDIEEILARNLSEDR